MNVEKVVAAQRGRVMTEEGHQICLFRWADLAAATMPELRWLYASANGGKRSAAVAAKLKAAGVKPGVSDLGLDVARKGFHGLRIELKVPELKAIPGVRKRVEAGRLSEEQKKWLAHYQANGYAAHVAYGWEQAMEILKEYLAK